jgi:putative addiction module antidote
MSATVKLRKIGNSLGLILPKEVADEMHVVEGDTLHVVTDANGTHLTPYDPNFDEAMKAFEQTRRTYRNALRALAK